MKFPFARHPSHGWQLIPQSIMMKKNAESKRWEMQERKTHIDMQICTWEDTLGKSILTNADVQIDSFKVICAVFPLQKSSCTFDDFGLI